MSRFIFSLALGAALTLPIVAQAADTPTTPRIIVSGEGEATAAPDLAMLTLSVMREAPTARAALDANNDAMAAVIAAMKSSGIEERDLQTAGIQINPRYDYSKKADGSQQANLVAYQVTNTLSIRVRDIDKTGEILDKAVTLGVNEGGGINFTNANPATIITQARKNAVANAIAKARTLAEAAGVKLGRVLEITDQNYAPSPMRINAKAFDAAPAAVPVQAGENSYRVQVNVTFEMK